MTKASDPARAPGKARRARVSLAQQKGMKMADQIEMPSWFDPERHIHNGRGVYERETGQQLAEDGLPMAGIVRAQRLAQAGATTDPLGLISDDLIASEGMMLMRKDAAAAAAAVVAEVSADAGGRKNKREASNAE